MGQADSYSEAAGAIGVAELEAVGLLFLVGEALVALGDHDKPILSLHIASVLIRMKFQG